MKHAQLCLALWPLALCLAADQPSHLEEVRHLRPVLRRVAGTQGLSDALRAEAGSVSSDADRVLSGKPDEASLLKVVGEYKKFVGDLMHRQDTLKSVAPAPQHEFAPEEVAKASALATSLETKVKTTLEHIKAEGDRGLTEQDAAARDAVVARLNASLAAGPADSKEDAVVQRAVALHEALATANGYFANRTAELGAEQATLAQQIQTGEAKILFMMLKQRKALPIKSQLAVLRRKQFKNSTYAQELIKKHNNHDALYKQLLALLPSDLVPKTAGGNATQHLEAAGSEGRVFVVSSRLKNKVKDMVDFLTQARDKLQAMAVATGPQAPSEAERAQAKSIVGGLNEMLGKVGNTKDLKGQLEAMDAVSKKLGMWTANLTAGAHAHL